VRFQIFLLRRRKSKQKMKSLVTYVAIALLASPDSTSCFTPDSVIGGGTRRSTSSSSSIQAAASSRDALPPASRPTTTRVSDETTATTASAASGGRRRFLFHGPLSTAVTSTFLLSLSSSSSSSSSSFLAVVSPVPPAYADDVVAVAVVPPPLPPPPPPPMAPSSPSYVSSIGDSATVLSQYLGHAISVIDGLNAQANRLSSSSYSYSSSASAHNVAVLEGMSTQSSRLVRDLDNCAIVLERIIKDDGYDITSGYPNDKLSILARNVSHASSVLDGLVVQGRRLERAINDASSSSGVMVGGKKDTDDEIVYLLGVLDGLNAQVERLDVDTTFGVLDEVVAEATRGA
jgi:hypothetical protein